MLDLKNTTALVMSLLKKDEQCRNSDGLLYLRVLTEKANEKGIDLKYMTVPYFLKNLHGTTFPPFESVRRARQRIQEKNPELAACKTVQEFRAENEKEYKSYAVGDIECN